MGSRATAGEVPMKARLTAVVAVCGGLFLAAPAVALGAQGTFTNATPITVPAGAPGTTLGNAAPYPSSIVVSGLPGPVVDVNVKLDNIGHEFPDDLDILLVSPSGDSVVLMSDACNGTPFEDFDWTFDDDAIPVMSDNPAGPCNNFFYKPSAYDVGTDIWPPALPGPHGSALTDFNGGNPNGAWHLYVRDDKAGDVGDIEAGWSITIETGTAAILLPGADSAGGSGVADPYPMTQAVSGQTGVIADVNVRLSGLSHQHPDDLDIMLDGPGGRRVVLMSDSCANFDYHDVTLTWDDEAPAQMQDTPADAGVCNAGAFRPTNHGSVEDLPAPAPPGPYATALSAFDALDANGTWRLYMSDDAIGDIGFVLNPFELEITTRPRANVRVTGAAAQVAEGGNASLTLTRSGPPGPYGAATVELQTVAGSAGAGDFTGSQTVSFAEGETEKTVSVGALADGAAERTETFTVQLAAATGDADVSGQPPLQVGIPGDDTKPAVKVLSRSLVLGARRRVSLALRGPAGEAEPTATRLTLTAKLPRRRGRLKRTVVARKSVALRPGRRTVVKLTLSRKATARLRARGRLALRLAVTATDAAGNRANLSRKLTAKPKRRTRRGA
jgi:subtilisin-like proprotein convertase family protein